MIGQAISHYKTIEKLSEGGMSQTYPRVPTLSGRVVESLHPLCGTTSFVGTQRRSL